MLAGAGKGKWSNASLSFFLDPLPEKQVVFTITPPSGFSIQNGRAGEVRTITLDPEQDNPHTIFLTHPGDDVRPPMPLFISPATSQDQRFEGVVPSLTKFDIYSTKKGTVSISMLGSRYGDGEGKATEFPSTYRILQSSSARLAIRITRHPEVSFSVAGGVLPFSVPDGFTHSGQSVSKSGSSQLQGFIFEQFGAMQSGGEFAFTISPPPSTSPFFALFSPLSVEIGMVESLDPQWDGVVPDIREFFIETVAPGVIAASPSHLVLLSGGNATLQLQPSAAPLEDINIRVLLPAGFSLTPSPLSSLLSSFSSQSFVVTLPALWPYPTNITIFAPANQPVVSRAPAAFSAASSRDIQFTSVLLQPSQVYLSSTTPGVLSVLQASENLMQIGEPVSLPLRVGLGGRAFFILQFASTSLSSSPSSLPFTLPMPFRLSYKLISPDEADRPFQLSSRNEISFSSLPSSNVFVLVAIDAPDFAALNSVLTFGKIASSDVKWDGVVPSVQSIPISVYDPSSLVVSTALPSATASNLIFSQVESAQTTGFLQDSHLIIALTPSSLPYSTLHISVTVPAGFLLYTLAGPEQALTSTSLVPITEEPSGRNGQISIDAGSLQPALLALAVDPNRLSAPRSPMPISFGRLESEDVQFDKGLPMPSSLSVYSIARASASVRILDPSWIVENGLDSKFLQSLRPLSPDSTFDLLEEGAPLQLLIILERRSNLNAFAPSADGLLSIQETQGFSINVTLFDAVLGEAKETAGIFSFPPYPQSVKPGSIGYRGDRFIFIVSIQAGKASVRNHVNIALPRIESSSLEFQGIQIQPTSLKAHVYSAERLILEGFENSQTIAGRSRTVHIFPSAMPLEPVFVTLELPEGFVIDIDSPLTLSAGSVAGIEFSLISDGSELDAGILKFTSVKSADVRFSGPLPEPASLPISARYPATFSLNILEFEGGENPLTLLDGSHFILVAQVTSNSAFETISGGSFYVSLPPAFMVLPSRLISFPPLSAQSSFTTRLNISVTGDSSLLQEPALLEVSPITSSDIQLRGLVPQPVSFLIEFKRPGSIQASPDIVSTPHLSRSPYGSVLAQSGRLNLTFSTPPASPVTFKLLTNISIAIKPIFWCSAGQEALQKCKVDQNDPLVNIEEPINQAPQEETLHILRLTVPNGVARVTLLLRGSSNHDSNNEDLAGHLHFGLVESDDLSFNGRTVEPSRVSLVLSRPGSINIALSADAERSSLTALSSWASLRGSAQAENRKGGFVLQTREGIPLSLNVSFLRPSGQMVVKEASRDNKELDAVFRLFLPSAFVLLIEGSVVSPSVEDIWAFPTDEDSWLQYSKPSSGSQRLSQSHSLYELSFGRSSPNFLLLMLLPPPSTTSDSFLPLSLGDLTLLESEFPISESSLQDSRIFSRFQAWFMAFGPSSSHDAAWDLLWPDLATTNTAVPPSLLPLSTPILLRSVKAGKISVSLARYASGSSFDSVSAGSTLNWEQGNLQMLAGSQFSLNFTSLIHLTNHASEGDVDEEWRSPNAEDLILSHTRIMVTTSSSLLLTTPSSSSATITRSAQQTTSGLSLWTFTFSPESTSDSILLCSSPQNISLRANFLALSASQSADIRFSGLYPLLTPPLSPPKFSPQTRINVTTTVPAKVEFQASSLAILAGESIQHQLLLSWSPNCDRGVNVQEGNAPVDRGYVQVKLRIGANHVPPKENKDQAQQPLLLLEPARNNGLSFTTGYDSLGNSYLRLALPPQPENCLNLAVPFVVSFPSPSMTQPKSIQATIVAEVVNSTEMLWKFTPTASVLVQALLPARITVSPALLPIACAGSLATDLSINTLFLTLSTPPAHPVSLEINLPFGFAFARDNPSNVIVDEPDAVKAVVIFSRNSDSLVPISLVSTTSPSSVLSKITFSRAESQDLQYRGRTVTPLRNLDQDYGVLQEESDSVEVYCSGRGELALFLERSKNSPLPPAFGETPISVFPHFLLAANEADNQKQLLPPPRPLRILAGHSVNLTAVLRSPFNSALIPPGPARMSVSGGRGTLFVNPRVVSFTKNSHVLNSSSLHEASTSLATPKETFLLAVRLTFTNFHMLFQLEIIDVSWLH